MSEDAAPPTVPAIDVQVTPNFLIVSPKGEAGLLRNRLVCSIQVHGDAAREIADAGEALCLCFGAGNPPRDTAAPALPESAEAGDRDRAHDLVDDGCRWGLEATSTKGERLRFRAFRGWFDGILRRFTEDRSTNDALDPLSPDADADLGPHRATTAPDGSYAVQGVVFAWPASDPESGGDSENVTIVATLNGLFDHYEGYAPVYLLRRRGTVFETVKILTVIKQSSRLEIVEFGADETLVGPKNPVTLSWKFTGARSCRLRPLDEDFAPCNSVGERVICPEANTELTLEARNYECDPSELTDAYRPYTLQQRLSIEVSLRARLVHFRIESPELSEEDRTSGGLFAVPINREGSFVWRIIKPHPEMSTSIVITPSKAIEPVASYDPVKKHRYIFRADGNATLRVYSEPNGKGDLLSERTIRAVIKPHVTLEQISPLYIPSYFTKLGYASYRTDKLTLLLPDERSFPLYGSGSFSLPHSEPLPLGTYRLSGSCRHPISGRTMEVSCTSFVRKIRAHER